MNCQRSTRSRYYAAQVRRSALASCTGTCNAVVRSVKSPTLAAHERQTLPCLSGPRVGMCCITYHGQQRSFLRTATKIARPWTSTVIKVDDRVLVNTEDLVFEWHENAPAWPALSVTKAHPNSHRTGFLAIDDGAPFTKVESSVEDPMRAAKACIG